MKILACGCVLCMLVLPCSALALGGAVPVPDWVKQAAAVSLPAYPATTRAVVLLDEESVTVAPDGTSIVHDRRVVKILRPQGRDDALVAVSSDVDRKLDYVHAWSIGPSGREYTVKDDEFTTTSADEEGILYNSLKYKFVRPPAADPGAVIAYEFERKERPYINEEDWEFQEDIPVLRSAFELDLPPGWKYYSAWLRYAPVTPSEPAPDHYRWELHNVSAIDMEDVDHAPDGAALAARMAAHYSNSELPDVSGRWAAVGKWYENLASTQAAVTPEIAAKAQELTVGETDFTEKLQSITQYLQKEIRYVGIEIGIGGYRPHAAADVFHNRYGDCKDKATLLKAMLGAIGIDATWVMVDSRRGVVDPALPSIYGNHMIAAIALPPGYESPVLQAVIESKSGKKYLIFDPTDSYTPVGEIRPQMQGGYGVLVDGDQSEIVQIPILSPGTNLLDRVAKFSLSPDGSLSGTVTENRSGSEATGPRWLYAESSTKEQRKVMEQRLQQDFSTFTLESSSAENSSELNKQFVLRYSITAPGYARVQGPLMLVQPRVMDSMSMVLDDKPRIYPIDLGAMRTERSTVELQLPLGYTVDELPDPVTVNTGFGSYHSTIKVQGSLMRYSRELVVSQLELKPEQYEDLRRFMGEIRADEESIVVLKKQ